MRFTLTGSRRDVRTLVAGDCSIAELAEYLTKHEVGDKDGEALIPALFNPCPVPCRHEGKPKLLNCGGGSSHRLNANVTHMTGLGVDLDGLAEGQLAGVLQQLRARGVLFFWWHTHSHNPPFDCRARVLIPFTEPLELKSAQQWSRLLWPALLEHFGLKQPADPSACDPSRVYFLPRMPEPNGPHAAGFVDGQVLDWRTVVGELHARPAVAQGIVPAPEQDPTRPVDLDDVRARLRTIDREPTRTLIRRVLKGEAPTDAPDVRKASDPSRYVAWRTVTGAVAAKAEDWEASEALLQLLHPAWAREVTESPSDHTEWETIESLLETARSGMPALRAQREAERAAATQRFREAFARRVRPQSPAVIDKTPQAPAEAAAVPEESATEEENPEAERDRQVAEWWAGCVLGPEKEDKETGEVTQALLQSPENAEATLRLWPEWRGVLRHNLVTHFAEMHGGPFLAPEKVRPLADHDGPNVTDWLARTVDLRLKDSVVFSRMLSVAQQRSYDPLKDYLQSTRKQWDGQGRLAGWLVRYFNARTVSTDGKDLTDHLSVIGRKWLLSAVARGLRPGCKADVVLELEGGQGVGKSTALKILGGDWYTDSPVDPDNKDALMLIAQSWIVELGELETFQRASALKQKRFFSQSFDDLRVPYGRTLGRFYRRCVFAGTTNMDDYLLDETGNRRHWPVVCGWIDLEGLAKDRDQLWGEAVALYEAADTCETCAADSQGRCPLHRWWLTAEEATTAEEEAQARMPPDLIAETLQDWLLGKVPAARPREVTVRQVATEALKDLPTGRASETKIGRAFKLLGFKRVRRRVAGVPRWVYEVPEELRTATKRENSTLAVLVNKDKVGA